MAVEAQKVDNFNATSFFADARSEKIEDIQTPPDDTSGQAENVPVDGNAIENDIEKVVVDKTDTTKHEPPVVVPTPAIPDAIPATTPPGIDEAQQALTFLRKHHNNPDLTLDDVMKPKVITPEQQQEQEQEIQRNAISYGLQEKKFTPEQQEAYSVDKNKDAKDIAFMIYAATIREQDNGVTPEEQLNQEILEGFNTEYGIELEKGDKYKTRKALQMLQIKDHYMKMVHGNIIGITEAYKKEQAIQQRAKDYTSNIDNAIAGLGQFKETITDPDGTYEVNVDYPQETLDAISKEFKSEEYFGRFGNEKPEQIQQLIKYIAIGRNMKKILETAGSAYYGAKSIAEKAARQGIVPNGGAGTNLERKEAYVPDQADSFLKSTVPGYQPGV